MTLPRRFQSHLEALRLAPGRVLVAVSGGVDSVVLLDLLCRLPDAARPALLVGHLDHGIHPGSAAVAARVTALAESLGLEVVLERLTLGAGASESLARRARLAWLREAAAASGCRWIFLAHHADDQDETVLMRALKGSGPAGLAGMAARRGRLVRPLLPFRRRTLERYAVARGLEWWEDPANADPRHLRSWLRSVAMPRLREQLPDLAAGLSSLRRHAAADRTAWRQLLASWTELGWRREGGVHSLDFPALLALPRALRLSLCQSLVRVTGGPAGAERIQRGLTTLAGAQSGATADLGAGWRLERSFDRLRVLSSPGRQVARSPRDSAAEATWRLGDVAPGSAEWGPWHLRWHLEPAPPTQPRDGATAWFIPGALTVRAWRPGDRVAPLGGAGARPAARCFQEARVPRSARSGWPMLDTEEGVAWIPGVCRSTLLVPRAGEAALRVDVEPRG